MAQLKDLLVSGPSRFVGEIFGDEVQLTTINAPTSAGGTTYGPGTSGQVLKSNGSSVYWTSDTDSNTHRPIQVNGTEILGNNTTALNLKAGSNVTLSNSSGTVTIAATNTTYTASTTSIGSASAGTAISADDITAWTTNTPTAVTKKTVVTSATFNTVVTGVTKKTVVTGASGATAAYADGVLTITNGSFSTGDSVTVTTGASGSATTGDSVSVIAGTAASLSYTSRSIPNISVTSKTVATGITAN